MIIDTKNYNYDVPMTDLIAMFNIEYPDASFTQDVKIKVDAVDDNINSGNTENHSFDLMTFRESSIFNIEDDLGNKKTINCNERYYVPSEITWLLQTLNFKKIEIFGAKLGAFSRNDSLSPDNYEMLVIAQK